jgi:hypothetical protein
MSDVIQDDAAGIGEGKLGLLEEDVVLESILKILTVIPFEGCLSEYTDYMDVFQYDGMGLDASTRTY